MNILVIAPSHQETMFEDSKKLERRVKACSVAHIIGRALQSQETLSTKVVKVGKQFNVCRDIG